MSRQFNFMPSQFVSRQVTPSHTTESRSERDMSVASGGQVADESGTVRTLSGGQVEDKERTTDAVPRDIQGTAAVVPRDMAGTGATTRRTAEQRANDSFRDFQARHLLEGLGQLRIMGRHSAQPLASVHFDHYFKHYGVSASRAVAAYRAGQWDRASGVRCLCNHCVGLYVSEAEEARAAYRTKRWKELQAEGRNCDDITRQIEDEIQRGMAQ